MKVFRRYSAALKAADGSPVLSIRNKGETLHIVGFGDDLSAALTEVSLHRSGIAGNVTLMHLNRLGNANHAHANPRWLLSCNAFPDRPTPYVAQPLSASCES